MIFLDPTAQIIVLLVLLLLSAMFSSAETALTTVNKIRIRSLAEEGRRSAKTVAKLIEEPSKMISAILIGNNLVNLSASSLTTTLAIRYFGAGYGTGIATGILTLLILIFGEITPKTLATIYNEKLSLIYAPVVLFVTKILTPIIFLVNKISLGLLLLFRINPSKKAAAITENELLTIVDVSHEEGVIESEEREMINNVVDFGDSLARDIMVPRIDMDFAEDTFDYDRLVEAFEANMYTRLPVYHETSDNVIGIVNLKDIFFYRGNKEDFRLADYLREPYFTYEYKKTSELLREMRKESISLAIVLDEYGATAGLITLEDLIEEIIGEIRDEYDEDEEDVVTAIGENEYLADGSAKLEEVNEALGLSLTSDDYDSIAGHVIYLLDHLPSEGESLTDGGVTYTVSKVDKNRIDKVHIKVDPDYEPEEVEEAE
ncbi:MAG: HlyC/CorC family transporter [Lachnospiraceae bacterium]|nr:HlyC/CorC family transporter [Lachnospiraceae bacterium]